MEVPEVNCVSSAGVVNGGDTLAVEDEVDDDVVIVEDVIEVVLNKVTELTEAPTSPPTSPPSTVATTCEAQVFTNARLVPYRDAEDSTSSDDSDSDSTSSESSDSSSDSDVAVICENPGEKRKRPPVTPPQRVRSRGIKTPGELDIEDLPPIEDLHITLRKEELHPVGAVYSIVDQLLVIEATPGQPALDLDSVLFRSGGDPVGQVFDVFGPVASPFYVVRFNRAEDIVEKGYQKGDPVYYAPLHADMTQYVFVSELKKLKGSDASWENDVEPPPEHLDYSDDEQEREARRAKKGQTSKSNNVWRRTDASPSRAGETRRWEVARNRQTPTPEQTWGAEGGAPWSGGCRIPGSGHGTPSPGPRGDSSGPAYPPPQLPPPRWMCAPPPQFGTPCQWPNVGPAAVGPDVRQLLGQLWSAPPPPPPPPVPRILPPIYGGDVARPRPPFGSFGVPIASPLWNVPSPRSESPGSEHARWTQFYDPVPDLQRILMTPPPSLQ